MHDRLHVCSDPTCAPCIVVFSRTFYVGLFVSRTYILTQLLTLYIIHSEDFDIQYIIILSFHFSGSMVKKLRNARNFEEVIFITVAQYITNIISLFYFSYISFLL